MYLRHTSPEGILSLPISLHGLKRVPSLQQIPKVQMAAVQRDELAPKHLKRSLPSPLHCKYSRQHFHVISINKCISNGYFTIMLCHSPLSKSGCNLPDSNKNIFNFQIKIYKDKQNRKESMNKDCKWTKWTKQLLTKHSRGERIDYAVSGSQIHIWHPWYEKTIHFFMLPGLIQKSKILLISPLTFSLQCLLICLLL